jgi:hypothetical protein
MLKSWLWQLSFSSRGFSITSCYTLPWSLRNRTPCTISLHIKSLGGNIPNGFLFFKKSILSFPNQNLKIHWFLRNLSMIFPMLMKILSPVILFLMIICSSLAHQTLGMEIFFSIFKPNVSNPIFLMKNIIVFTTILNTTLSSVTLFIVVVFIFYYDVV